ncbi:MULTISPECIES: DUF3592 domain-containing protein [unclassified Inquilinus]|uniref:DUF3592 domain-containing protein n=1 Tax=unclassified Inquilinus TaxID=2645927 RepID=UPI003F93395A
MSNAINFNGSSAPRRHKSFWRIAWESGLLFGLLLLLGGGFVASALLPGAPAMMKVWTVAGTRGSTAACGILAALVALLFLWFALPNTIRRWRLARHGVAAQGIVTRTEPFLMAPASPASPKGAFRFRPEHRIYVHYRFRDAAGREHDGRGSSRTLWPRPAPGDPIVVIYNPRRPSRSLPAVDLTV